MTDIFHVRMFNDYFHVHIFVEYLYISLEKCLIQISYPSLTVFFDNINNCKIKFANVFFHSVGRLFSIS